MTKSHLSFKRFSTILRDMDLSGKNHSTTGAGLRAGKGARYPAFDYHHVNTDAHVTNLISLSRMTSPGHKLVTLAG